MPLPAFALNMDNNNYRPSKAEPRRSDRNFRSENTIRSIPEVGPRAMTNSMVKKISLLIILLFSLPIVLPLATRKMSSFIQGRRDTEAGLFPACKRMIDDYFNDPGITLTSVKAVPDSSRKSGNIVNGEIDISYSLSGSSELSPEDGAKVYATGIAIGLDPKEVAESVASRIGDGQPYNYRRRLEYSYSRKNDQCLFGNKVIDLDENRELETAVPSILNETRL
jgi:hypothetical protein